MSKVADAHLPIKEKLGPKLPCNDSAKHMKIKRYDYETWKRKKKKNRRSLMMMKQFISQYPTIGFGVPTIHRTLPKAAIEPPHFYYENVALAHKGIWTTILRFLYDVEPEFVNSKLVSSPSTSTTDHS